MAFVSDGTACFASSSYEYVYVSDTETLILHQYFRKMQGAGT